MSCAYTHKKNRLGKRDGIDEDKKKLEALEMKVQELFGEVDSCMKDIEGIGMTMRGG